MTHPWERYPVLAHLDGAARERLERRRRHRQVRYLLFRLSTAIEAGRTFTRCDGLPPGFVEFWLGERPAYAMTSVGRAQVPSSRDLTVARLGGYGQFARRWDVDEDLHVYLRHTSVWQEWHATLMRVVPVLGE